MCGGPLGKLKKTGRLQQYSSKKSQTDLQEIFGIETHPHTAIPVVRKPKKTAQNTAPIDMQQSCVWLLVSVAEVCFLPMLLLLTSLQHDYPWYCYHIESFGQYGSDMQSLYATGHLKNHREHIKNNCKCANYKQVCYRFAQPIGKATGKADSSQLAELHIPTGGQVSIIIIYTQNNCL